MVVSSYVVSHASQRGRPSNTARLTEPSTVFLIILHAVKVVSELPLSTTLLAAESSATGLASRELRTDDLTRKHTSSRQHPPLFPAVDLSELSTVGL